MLGGVSYIGTYMRVFCFTMHEYCACGNILVG